MTTSPWSVGETVARLKGVLESKGIKLFAVIDHSGEAEAVSSSGIPSSSSSATRSRGHR